MCLRHQTMGTGMAGAGHGARATNRPSRIGRSADAGAERARHGTSGNEPTHKEQHMATTGATGSSRFDRRRADGIRGRIAEHNHETKASFKTTEFWAMLGLVVAILVSAALIKGGDNGTDEFIARQAWLYVSILAGAYFISRGLAKSGSYEPDRDYNPVDISERARDRAGDGR